MKILFILFFSLASALYADAENISAAASVDRQVVNKESHYSQPWKVHKIAQDFNLLDVWEYPILADKSKGQDFFYFLKMLQQPSPDETGRFDSIKHLAARFLIFLRMHLGEILGLDKNINTLPIPGCRETSITDRLSLQDRNRSLALSELGLSHGDNNTWRIVYLFDNEMLSELSINPAHVLMHLGWVHKSGNLYTARLAVYAKPRGTFGNLYLRLIMPFRRAIIYPSLMEHVNNIWESNKQKEHKEVKK